MQENNLHSKSIVLTSIATPGFEPLKKQKAGGPRLGNRADSSCKREILRVNSKSKEERTREESLIGEGVKERKRGKLEIIH
jgi:hypothetical protein